MGPVEMQLSIFVNGWMCVYVNWHVELTKNRIVTQDNTLIEITFLALFHGICHGPVLAVFSFIKRSLSFSARAFQWALSSGESFFHSSDGFFDTSPTCCCNRVEDMGKI